LRRQESLHVAEAMQAATDGPVNITGRGAPAYVFLSIEDDRRLRGEFVSLANARPRREAKRVSIAFFRLSSSTLNLRTSP